MPRGAARPVLAMARCAGVKQVGVVVQGVSGQTSSSREELPARDDASGRGGDGGTEVSEAGGRGRLKGTCTLSALAWHWFAAASAHTDEQCAVSNAAKGASRTVL